jgi:hypothetical protein
MPPGWHHEPPAARDGIPWESAGDSMLSRWWRTLGATMRGRVFYANVATSDDAMSAVTFHTVTWAVMGFVTGATYFLLLGVVGAAVAIPFGKGGGPGAIAGSVWLFGAACWLGLTLAGALLGFVLPWVVGGIHHLILAMLGGVPPDRTYAHTVRAQAYASAGSAIFSVVPYIGSLVTLILGVKLHIDAYNEVHRCGAGETLLALGAPLVCSCCGCLGFSTVLSVVSALSP